MDRHDLIDLYRYDDWANARLVGALRALPAEAALRPHAGSFANLRDLLAHVVGADWIWLERFRGASPAAMPEWFASGAVGVLADRFEEIAARRRELLAGLADADLAVELSFRYLNGRAGAIALGDALFHVTNHATYHRGQLASMLRALGATPPATDFTQYLAETRGA